MLGKAIGAAWEQHRQTYRPEQAKEQGREAKREERQADRFGRSRDRQRQPRQERETDKADEARETGRAGEAPAEAEKTPLERGSLSGQFPCRRKPRGNSQPARGGERGQFRAGAGTALAESRMVVSGGTGGGNPRYRGAMGAAGPRGRQRPRTPQVWL